MKHSPFPGKFSPTSALSIAPVGEPRKRPYRGRREQMDGFFCARRIAEVGHGLIVGLDRCRNVLTSERCVPVAWYLHINGTCFRCETIDDASAFLRGYCAGLAVKSGPVGVGELPPVVTGRITQKVMG